MLPNIGFGELVVILVIALLLFGAQRLPEVARGIGRSVNAFKQGLRELSDETDKREIAASSAVKEAQPAGSNEVKS